MTTGPGDGSPGAPVGAPAKPGRSRRTDGEPRVVAAARELFRVQGLAATQAEVAREAGVGVATLYRRFPSKADLVLAVYRPALEAAGEAAAAAAAGSPAAEALDRFMRGYTAAMVRDRGLMQLVTNADPRCPRPSLRTPSGREIQRILSVTDRRIEGLLDDLLRRAVAEGAVRRDFQVPDVQMIGVAVQAVHDWAGPVQPALSERLLALILDGMSSQRRSPTPIASDALTLAQLRVLTHRADYT